MGNAAGTIEPDDGTHDDASRGVEAGADTPQDFEQLFCHPDGGAATSEILAGTLEDNTFPANRPQQVRGKVPAD